MPKAQGPSSWPGPAQIMQLLGDNRALVEHKTPSDGPSHAPTPCTLTRPSEPCVQLLRDLLNHAFSCYVSFAVAAVAAVAAGPYFPISSLPCVCWRNRLHGVPPLREAERRGNLQGGKAVRRVHAYWMQRLLRAHDSCTHVAWSVAWRAGGLMCTFTSAPTQRSMLNPRRVPCTRCARVPGVHLLSHPPALHANGTYGIRTPPFQMMPC